MGQQQSKDELLYQQVNYGNIEGIKSLCREGAGLEWIDKEGRTPLILACMNPQLFNVAKALIELGANANAYRPGCHGGTPLHHAAKRGLQPTVQLLLSNGANPLVMNDDCQTALDVARQKGFTNIVRTIEHKICLFYGWMRELYGPGFLEALAPKWLSKKIWVVVLPCSSRYSATPLKVELAIYTSPQDAMPRTVIALWKAKVEPPKFQLADPTFIVIDNCTKTRYKLASANDGDKQQLQQFDNACRGIPQVNHAPIPQPVPATAPPTTAEDVELAMALDASIHSATERPPLPNTHPSSAVSNTNNWGNSADNSSHNGWGTVGEEPAPPSAGVINDNDWGKSAENSSHNSWGTEGGGPAPPPPKTSSSGLSDKPAKDPYNGWSVSEVGSSSSHLTEQNIPAAAAPPIPQEIPSAPPIPEMVDDGPVSYPSIDFSPIDVVPIPSTESKPAKANETKEDGSCVICLDAPVEGACIPCGHMAGCMSCLKEIQAKKWGCPVCRAKIQQVIRLYAV